MAANRRGMLQLRNLSVKMRLTYPKTKLVTAQAEELYSSEIRGKNPCSMVNHTAA